MMKWLLYVEPREHEFVCCSCMYFNDRKIEVSNFILLVMLAAKLRDNLEIYSI